MRVKCCMWARDPRKYKLSNKLLNAIEQAFKAMDNDNSREIDVCEALGFFKNFGKVNAKVLFEEMDEDGDGKITFDEWVFYFKRVACTGLYSEDDIIEEIDSIVQGESFMHFRTAKPAESPTRTGSFQNLGMTAGSSAKIVPVEKENTAKMKKFT